VPTVPDFPDAPEPPYSSESDGANKAVQELAKTIEGLNKEAVDHPAHYGGKDNPYEAIKVIEAWELGFCLGNTVKYISRAGKKGDCVEDLKKAAWYLQREISRLENVPAKQEPS
jgi:hypothetical protein